MQFVKDDIEMLLEEIHAEEFAEQQISQAADDYARSVEDKMLDINELDPVACPPDRRFFYEDREAWVYDHGNISELIFVKTD